MPDHEERTIIEHTFKGPRFDDHGLDVEVLSELKVFKDILLDLIEELWRKNNPDNKRLPNNFSNIFTIKFYEIKKGSTVVPLKQVAGPQEGLFIKYNREVDEAIDIISKTLHSIALDKPLPAELPKQVLAKFKGYGETLKQDECFEIKEMKTGFTSKYSMNERKKILEYIDSCYEDVVEYTGEIRSADLDGLNFKLKLDSGLKINGKFTKEQEELITKALKEHNNEHLYVKGKAEFNPDGSVEKIINIDCMKIISSEIDDYDYNARPFWEIAKEISDKVSDKEWGELPTDLSENFEHYMYGSTKGH